MLLPEPERPWKPAGNEERKAGRGGCRVPRCGKNGSEHFSGGGEYAAEKRRICPLSCRLRALACSRHCRPARRKRSSMCSLRWVERGTGNRGARDGKGKRQCAKAGKFFPAFFSPFLQKRAGRRCAPGGLTFAGRFAIMKSRAKTRPDGAGRGGTIQSLFRTEGFYIFLTFFYHFRKTRDL